MTYEPFQVHFRRNETHHQAIHDDYTVKRCDGDQGLGETRTGEACGIRDTYTTQYDMTGHDGAT